MQEMIKVEKEVYEAVLRNSVRVIDLEAENQQLKELLKDCRFILREMSDVNNWLESDDCVLNYDMATECEKYATKITNAIGEK